MSMNQRVRSETCWALSLLWRKRSEKRKVLGATEGDLGTGPLRGQGYHACVHRPWEVAWDSSFWLENNSGSQL